MNSPTQQEKRQIFERHLLFGKLQVAGTYVLKRVELEFFKAHDLALHASVVLVDQRTPGLVAQGGEEEGDRLLLRVGLEHRRPRLAWGSRLFP